MSLPVVLFFMHSTIYSLYLSLFHLLIFLCHFIISAFPAPIVFGLIIDTTCLVLQGCATSRRGACLLYDNDLFRWRLHGFSFAVKAIACVLYVITMFMSRGIDYHDQEYGEEGENDTKDNETKDNNNKEMVVTTDFNKNKDYYKNGKADHDPEEMEKLASVSV